MAPTAAPPPGARLGYGRIYDEPAPDPAGRRRVLVDRLWPRGVSKERAALDAWARGAAPSDELRRWYAHVPERFGEFRDRYRAELDGRTGDEDLERLLGWARDPGLLLLTATRDLERSGAAVLAEWIADRLGGRAGTT
jgi:uncharacterized protein YeaO (DUF488 family)